MLKTLFITKKLFQIIHTILMLISFTYIIAVNLNSLSQILGVHIVSLKNKGYHCRMSQTYHIHVTALQQQVKTFYHYSILIPFVLIPWPAKPATLG